MACLSSKGVLFSPKDDISLALGEVIGCEHFHINIMMYNFTDMNIAKDLIEARARGVNVTIIVDISALAYPGVFPMLADAGVRVLVFNPSKSEARLVAAILKNRDRGVWPLMHNKSWLFFRNYDRRRVLVTGSYNATQAVATWHNEENAILCLERDVFDSYRDHFYDMTFQCTDYREFQFI